MTVGQFLGVWGATVLVLLVPIALSLVLHYRAGSAAKLQSEVRQLSIDVEELFTAVEKWTKRRIAADARSRIGVTEPAAPDPSNKAVYKAYLRQKAKGFVQ